MGFGGGGGTGKQRSDINVTPLVDIVLVMLIIFLVAMPVVMMKIDLEVPSKLDQPPEVDIVLPDQVTIEVTKSGAILLNTIEINRTDLAQKLRDRLEHKREKVVFVDFDDNTPYGDAVSIMDTAKGAGATTIAMKMKDVGGPTAPGVPGAPAAPGAPGPTVTPINP